jgi:nucleoid-associated protein YgaU
MSTPTARHSTPPGATSATPVPSGRRDPAMLVRGLAAVIGTAFALVAVPGLVWAWRSNPLPSSFEPRRWAELATAGYVHPDVVPDLLAVALWLVWAQLALAVLREVIAQVRRGTAASRSRLVLPPVQTMAARTVAFVSVLFSTPAPAPSLAALSGVAVVQATPGSGVAAATSQPASEHTSHGPSGASSGPPARAYVCGPYETLRSIADDVYGDPEQWTSIRDASVGVAQPDDSSLTKGFVTVDEGTVLRIPDVAGTEGDGHSILLASAATSTPETWTPLTPRHTVRPGDTLWDIAGDCYPDGIDKPAVVRAIFDANRGIGDGHGRRLYDRDVLHPGMRLRLPAVHGPADGHRGVVQERPDGAGRAPSPAPDPAPSTSTPDSLQGQPRGSFPGILATATGRDESPRSSAPPLPDPPDARDDVDAGLSVEQWIERAALLVAGFVALLSFRRRRRDAKIRPGQVPPEPDAGLTGLHTALLAADDPAWPLRLDEAVRSIAAMHRRANTAGPADQGLPLIQVLLRHADGDIEAFLDRISGGDPPSPWRATVDRRIWRLPAAAELGLDDAARQMPHPNPTLVQLGVTDDGAALLIDLEAVGVLALDDEPGQDTGSPVGVRGIARAMTATLATSPLAGVPRIRTSGFDPYGFANEERIHTHATVEDLRECVQADARHLTEALAGDGHQHSASTLSLRATHADEAVEPVVAVVADRDLTPEQADPLIRLADGGGRGVAVVLPLRVAPAATWRLVHLRTPRDVDPAPDSRSATPIGLPESRWRLDPLGVTVRPAALAADELAGLAALLDEADAPPTTPAVVLPFRRSEPGTAAGAEDGGAGEPQATSSVTGPSTSPTFEPPAWRVMVRLLGPPDVVGRDGSTADDVRDRTVEALAWLVLHRGGTRPRMEAAMWPAGARPGTIANTLSRARTALAQLAGDEAQSWIPGYASDLTISSDVTTDLYVLQDHLAFALRHRDQPDVAVPVLRSGLALVRGVPAGYPWLDAELGSTLTTTPTTAAALLAELSLDLGDIDGVLDATASGLGVLPAHPGLFALRLRAHATAGDRVAVRSEYEAYLRAEAADPLADGETDRDLERLYLYLLRALAR